MYDKMCHSSTFCAKVFVVVLALLNGFPFTSARMDIIQLKDDKREVINLVSFGMYQNATLTVALNVSLPKGLGKKFGFTIERTEQAALQSNSYQESMSSRNAECISSPEFDKKNMVMLWMCGDRLGITKGDGMQRLNISSPGWTDSSQLHEILKANQRCNASLKSPPQCDKNGEFVEHPEVNQTTEPIKANEKVSVSVNTSCSYGYLPLKTQNQENISLNFILTVAEPNESGLYSIYFHNCGKDIPMSISANITGLNVNPYSYLSAGDIPQPYIYFTVCVTYFLLSFLWLGVLLKASSGVFKTHYLMLTVCYCKSLSALCHGMNFYYISIKGKEETAWAVIFYISYLMKTLMLFLTIMLVGSGWTFIKHVFSDKEKKLFLVAIPLQLLAYISDVIIHETEIADRAYTTWQTISIVVNLLCFAAILMPVIWSIRHLQEASQTNGKAALNLRKLKLFRTLYIMVIAYIYVTGVIILLMKHLVNFQVSWLSDAFTELTLLMFLTMLGFKFRPADNNPYFQIPPDSDDDEQVEMAVTKSGIAGDAKRRVFIKDDPVDGKDVERQTLLTKQDNESSHELD